LKNGRVFYGYFPSTAQVYFYRYFLGNRQKPLLIEDAVNVAYDIAVRYLGPKSPNDYINQGKYYGFLPGDTIAEVGAFMGYYAIRAAEIVGPMGKVIAVEAVEENLQLLRKNVEANFPENIIIVPKAAWESAGHLKFFRTTRQQASAISSVVNVEEEFSVACDTVDNILKSAGIDQVKFVRVQVNGAEREVLSGMNETLKSFPKLLVAAIYERGGRESWVEIKSLLENRGYTVLVSGANVFAHKANPETTGDEI
jgi:FkbM family methyltransferase